MNEKELDYAISIQVNGTEGGIYQVFVGHKNPDYSPEMDLAIFAVAASTIIREESETRKINPEVMLEEFTDLIRTQIKNAIVTFKLGKKT